MALSGMALLLPRMAAASESIELLEFRSAGNGCPRSSASGLINAEGDFEILLTDFEAVASAQAPGAAALCNFLVKIKVPQGQKFRIGDVFVSGFGRQEQGAGAFLRSTYGYMGMEPEEWKWDLNLGEALEPFQMSGSPRNTENWPDFCGGEVEIRGSLGALVRRSPNGATAEIYAQTQDNLNDKAVLWDWQTTGCEGP